MYVDAFGQFADAQALTGDAQSTNTVDLGLDKNRLGSGEPMAVVVVVDSAITGTLSVDLVSDTADGPALGTVISTRAFAAAAAAGSKLVIDVPQGAPVERFIALDFNGATGGSVTAFLTLRSMVQDEEVYADNITIS